MSTSSRQRCTRSDGGSSTSLADRVARLKKPPEPLPGVDDDLMRVLLDGLAYAPADRPTAAQFRDRLVALEANYDGTGGPSRKRMRQLALTLLAVTVLSLLVVMLVIRG